MTLVKICGITNKTDAKYACSNGANLLGMIIWPKAKRSVNWDLARDIASVARDHGVTPVGVFVDESAEKIVEAYEKIGLGAVQLHGDGARSSLPDIPSSVPVIYVLNATPDGVVVTKQPRDLAKEKGLSDIRSVDYVLYDSLQGGSGQKFDWTKIQPAADASTKGWLLAGGLVPANVSEAVRVAKPSGVDVSSGVCGADGLLKDHERVLAFIRNAKAALD